MSGHRFSSHSNGHQGNTPYYIYWMKFDYVKNYPMYDILVCWFAIMMTLVCKYHF